MTKRYPALLAVLLLLFPLAACDVEKQMDTMVDNPSFAEPLFTKFMARSEYQVKAMDTILADPAMRQLMLEKIVSNEEYARAIAQQLMSHDQTRVMIGQMVNGRTADTTPSSGP